MTKPTLTAQLDALAEADRARAELAGATVPYWSVWGGEAGGSVAAAGGGEAPVSGSPSTDTGAMP